ncbi:MAG TPA: hypothetical protein VFK30_15010, partial [Anaerolineae bacterium]|nr:hypothetical protein [Anaerolineae bacterium]
YAITGTFVSSVKDANPAVSGATKWTTLAWNATTPAGTAIKFQAAASNNSTGPFNFVGPDGTAGSYFTTTSASLGQFNGLRYLEYAAYLSTTNTSTTPVLSDVTVCFNNSLNASYTITPTAGANGSISPGSPQTVTVGSSITFTMVPNLNYHVADVGVDGVSQGSISSYTFKNVNMDHVITAAFAINIFIITPTAGSNGSFVPGTAQTVNYGSAITFTIAPNTGYHIADVGVDGISQGVVSSYIINTVTANHTITAAFAINTFIITPTAGSNGSIVPGTAQTVNYGSTITFTIVPSIGYHIADVGVDSASQGSLSSYTFVNVTTNHVITAAFAINT